VDVSTTTGAEGGPQQDPRGISDEEARELVQELRSAPAEQVVTEVLFTVLNTARVLINLSTVMLEYLREYVSDDLVERVDQALGQLRLGQVSAESEAARTGKTEPNDLDRIPSTPTPDPSSRP
jgi:hypothetical protein